MQRDPYLERMLRGKESRAKLYLIVLLIPLYFDIVLLIAGVYLLYLGARYIGWI